MEKLFKDCDLKLQKNILDKYNTINVDHDDWYNFILDNWYEKLLEHGFDIKNINKKGIEYYSIAFSGFSSQGDGASFTCDRIDIERWIKTNNIKKYNRILKLINNNNINYSAEIIRNSRYNHENSTSVYIDWNYLYSTRKNIDNIDNLLEELANDITQHHIELNKEIYNDLNKVFYDLISEEAVKDTLIINEYKFNEEGTIVH